jgi:hypothetical protein
VIISLTDSGWQQQERAKDVPNCIGAAAECAPGEIESLRTQLNDLRRRLFKHAA